MPNKQDIALFACRFCGAGIRHRVIDLGMAPLCENYLSAFQLHQMEAFYPLNVYVCDSCFLVQLQEHVPRSAVFHEYAYFSSYSDSWVQHAKNYAEMIAGRVGLGAHSFIVEVGSNDGYLLQHFLAKGIPALGVEPAANVAKAAEHKGVRTRVQFFSEEIALDLVAEGKQADLIVGNNVLAQVPDLNDFMRGVKALLNSDGVVTMEFPHLMRLIEGNQFDTIYLEHFSYFSLYTVERVFAAHGLRVFDVEELPTHGGSLRIYARHSENPEKKSASRVEEMRSREIEAGLIGTDFSHAFGARVKETKWKLLEFLILLKRKGKTIAGYGAPGKGNTLLNYCGIRTDLLDYTVDRNPYKQGKYTPGTHIPICPVERIRETKPDYVLILPWNLKAEVMQQLAYICEWGGQFVVPIPEVQVCRP